MEQIAQQLKNGEKVKLKGGAMKGGAGLPAKYTDARKQINGLLGTKVQISRAKSGKGKITIAFDSDTAFDSIISKLGQIKN